MEKQILVVELQISFDAGVADRLIHAVHGAQERGFAAAGRANEGGNFVGGNVEADIVQGLESTIEEIDIASGQFQGGAGFGQGSLFVSVRHGIFQGLLLLRRCHD